MIQKSKVQEMFPTMDSGSWWRAFVMYGLIIAFFGPLLVRLMLFILGYSAKGLGNYDFLVWALSFIVSYFLANRSVRNFYFDITPEGIVVRSSDSFDFLRTIPFSKVLDVTVRSVGGGRYTVETVPVRPFDAMRARCQLYYFDKETALALKEYILAKMRDAKKTGV